MTFVHDDPDFDALTTITRMPTTVPSTASKVREARTAAMVQTGETRWHKYRLTSLGRGDDGGLWRSEA